MGELLKAWGWGIDVFSPEGIFITELSGSEAIAVDSEGDVYVTDRQLSGAEV